MTISYRLRTIFWDWIQQLNTEEAMAERKPNTATSSSGCLLWRESRCSPHHRRALFSPISLQQITLPLGLPPPGMSQPYSGAKAPHKNLRLLMQPSETPNKSASNTNSSTRGGRICSRRVVAFHIKCLEPPFHSCP